jgi:homoserine O-acetyltransferase
MTSGLSALLTQDVFKQFGESESKAVSAVKAKLFVIVASQDHCVNPAPALSFAKTLGAQTMILDDDNGHSSPGAEIARVGAAIDAFLVR